MRTQPVSSCCGLIWRRLDVRGWGVWGCHVVYCTSFLMLFFLHLLQVAGQAWVWQRGRRPPGKSSYQKLGSRIKINVQEKREGTQGCGLTAGLVFWCSITGEAWERRWLCKCIVASMASVRQRLWEKDSSSRSHSSCRLPLPLQVQLKATLVLTLLTKLGVIAVPISPMYACRHLDFSVAQVPWLFMGRQ